MPSHESYKVRPNDHFETISTYVVAPLWLCVNKNSNDKVVCCCTSSSMCFEKSIDLHVHVVASIANKEFMDMTILKIRRFCVVAQRWICVSKSLANINICIRVVHYAKSKDVNNSNDLLVHVGALSRTNHMGVAILKIRRFCVVAQRCLLPQSHSGSIRQKLRCLRMAISMLYYFAITLPLVHTSHYNYEYS